jgi:hypothetical protein
MPLAVEEGEKLLLGASTCFVERWKKIVDKTGHCWEIIIPSAML